MRKVKVLTAFLGFLTAGTFSGTVLDAGVTQSVSVEIEDVSEQGAVTPEASIETPAVATTTLERPVTASTEEQTTASEAETTITEDALVSATVSSTVSTTAYTTAAAVVSTTIATTTKKAETAATSVNTPAPAAEEVTTVTAPAESHAITISDSDYILLCNVVGHEYGSDWVPIYEKALVVEVVMNRVNSDSGAFPDTIYGVLTQKNQFSGSYAYVNLGTFSYQVTESVKAAVDLYLSDPTQFNHGYLFFTGDGKRNYFR